MHPTTEQLAQLSGIDVVSVTPEVIASGGAHSRIYACDSGLGPLILRVCAKDQGYHTDYFKDWIDRDRWMDQRWATDICHQAGLAVPDILWSDRSLRWVLMTRLPGEPIQGEVSDWDGCPYDEKDFGTILADVHKIATDGFGPIDDEGHTVFDTWSGFLIALAESAIQTGLQRDALTEDVVRILDPWKSQLADLTLDQPKLLHMESLGFANLMVDTKERRVTGLLDFEDCLGGDPLFELVWMHYYYDILSSKSCFDFDRFHAGYGKVDPDPHLIRMYSVFPYLDKLRFIEPESERASRYRKLLLNWMA